MKEDEEMFKLYGYVEDERYGRKLDKLAQCETEYELIKAIDLDIRTNEWIHYFVIKRENNTDNYYLSINCYEDFIDYIDYYRRSKEKSEKQTR